jgi:hypothetical protein
VSNRVRLGGASAFELIGRARECKALAEMLDAVRAGTSRVLALSGDAGIGKSALLQHLTDAASGFKVMHAIGVESEMELALPGFTNCASPYSTGSSSCQNPNELRRARPSAYRQASRPIACSSGSPC